MKALLLTLLLAIPLHAYCADSLLNKPMPLLRGQTLDGTTIDATYFKERVTVVNFMYIGCMPCMNEIGLMNKLAASYKDDNRVQFLCIARQLPDQMKALNDTGKSVFATVRKALGAEPFKYPVLPACNDAVSKMKVHGTGDNESITLKAECNTIADVFGINAYPTTFFVDRHGIIRKIDKGGPGKAGDEQFYNKLKAETDSLIASN